jgi:hypothetical protein
VRHGQTSRLRLHPFAGPSRQPGGFQEARELRRRLVLRDRAQLLEGARESVRQAPHRSRLELIVLRAEVEVVDPSGQVLRDPRLVLDERLLDDQLRHRGGELPPLPLFNGASQAGWITRVTAAIAREKSATSMSSCFCPAGVRL